MEAIDGRSDKKYARLFCMEVSKCVYDKIDVFDKISKDHIIHAIISYFNDIIPNSNFYF